jgi:predicted metal-dependent hydrolase
MLDLNLKSIKICNIEFKIEILYLKKKHFSASIKDRIIKFRCPKNISKNIFDKCFENLLEKIKKKIEKNPLEYIDSEDTKIKKIMQQSFFYFNNELFQIKFHNFKYGRITKDKIIYLNPNQNLKTHKHLIRRLLEKYYLNWINDYVNKINKETYNYKINKVLLKTVRSKWGHCTSIDEILINLKLLNGDRKFLDYVIIHELSHIEHKNHSEKFWKNVERFSKDYKQIKKELIKNPPKIF